MAPFIRGSVAIVYLQIDQLLDEDTTGRPLIAQANLLLVRDLALRYLAPMALSEPLETY